VAVVTGAQEGLNFCDGQRFWKKKDERERERERLKNNIRLYPRDKT